MEKIEAGFLQKLKNFLGKLESSFSKYALEYDNKKTEGNSTIYYYSYDDGKKNFATRITPLDEEGNFILQFKPGDGADSNEPYEVSPVGFKDVMKQLQKAQKKYFGDESFDSDESASGQSASERFSSSRQMNVKLEKVVGSKGYDIFVNAIECNYDTSVAVVDLNTILDDADFIEEIPEGESSYSIIPSEDEALDIEYLDDLSTPIDTLAEESYNCILCTLIQGIMETKYLIWMLGETYGSFLSDITTNLNNELSWQSDRIAFDMKYHSLCPCVDCCSFDNTISNVTIDEDSVYSKLKEIIDNVLNCYEFNYCNMDHVTQQLIDNNMISLREISNRIQSRM